jgi:subtilisin family serine protease
VKILKTFTSEVFSGVAIEALDDNIESLQAISPVARVWRSQKVQLESPPSTFTPQTFADDTSAPEYNIHGITNVDRVHALGILGKGAKVGVVDTGVDYNHPAVRAGFCIFVAFISDVGLAWRLFWSWMQSRWWL